MSKKLKTDRSSSGFTLLETAVVVMIIGILAAIALTAWLGFIEVWKLNTSQQQVYSAMRQAQGLAVKNKLTWQASFRERDGFVEWTVHQADARQFISDAVMNNDQLWHKLSSNIRVDVNRNDKGYYETTLRRHPTQLVWRAIFNYQGCPVSRVGHECINTSIQALGQITLYSTSNPKPRRCVYISTVLGAMRTAKEHSQASKNGKYCY